MPPRECVIVLTVRKNVKVVISCKLQVISCTHIDMVKMVKKWQVLKATVWEMAFIHKLQQLPYWPWDVVLTSAMLWVTPQASKVASERKL